MASKPQDSVTPTDQGGVNTFTDTNVSPTFLQVKFYSIETFSPAGPNYDVVIHNDLSTAPLPTLINGVAPKGFIDGAADTTTVQQIAGPALQVTVGDALRGTFPQFIGTLTSGTQANINSLTVQGSVDGNAVVFDEAAGIAGLPTSLQNPYTAANYHTNGTFTTAWAAAPMGINVFGAAGARREPTR